MSGKPTCANCGQEATCTTPGGVRTCQRCLPWAARIEDQADTIADLRTQLEASRRAQVRQVGEVRNG